MQQTSLLLFAPAPAVSITKAESLEALVARANAYAVEARARATRKAYLSDFRSFEAWCTAHGLLAMPAAPATVAVYLAALAGQGRRPSTIERALAGIGSAHRARGYAGLRGQPAIMRVMGGIRREHGIAPAQKAPLGDDELAAMMAVLGEDLVGRRDRALLTLGWMGAFRRSELVALRIEDVMRTGEGLIVRVRRSKGDQEGRGGAKGIPYASSAPLCAVRAVMGWLEVSGITVGALFRGVDRHGRVHDAALNDRSVARIVQQTAARAGLDPKRVAGHSLRSGFATTAAKKGKGLDAIMRQTLHRSERVARSYIRQVGMFENNAAMGLV